MIRALPYVGAALLAAAVTTGCGEGTVRFGGDTDENETTFITVTGEIDNKDPDNPQREVVVFVFTALGGATDDPKVLCTLDFSVFVDSESIILTADATEFTVDRIDSGDLVVVFLLDNASDQADGQIDDGDLIAVLDDPDDVFENVRANFTVTVERADLNFGTYRILAAPDEAGNTCSLGAGEAPAFFDDVPAGVADARNIYRKRT